MTDYNEQFLGDLSDDYTNPTAHEFYPGEIVLFAGSNVITGSTTPGNPSANPVVPPDRDFFTFEVPDGFTVTSITLNDYQWGNGDQTPANYGNSYFAVVAANSFPSITSNDGFLISKLIDNKTGESEEGLDLLEPGVGSSYLDDPEPGVLGPGVYSVWYQETGANTTYEFNVVLDAPDDANFGTVQFSPSTIQVNESADMFDLTLTRTGGSDGAVSVVLRRTGGTAENLVDFSFTPATVTFKDGETQKVLSYPIADDDSIEGNETVTFELDDPAGGVSLGTAREATLTIVDNDPDDLAILQTIQFNASTVQANEAAGTVNLTLVRTGASNGAVTVQVSQTGGSAQNAVDLNLTPVTVEFAAGETEKTISVAIVDDTLIETNETAIFKLSAPTGGAALGTTQESTLTIIDNDFVINPGQSLQGTGDPNRLVGGAGNDTILGLGGDDRLIGNEGDDQMTGGGGDDRLNGGPGNDQLKGGPGKDSFIFDTGAAFDKETIGVDTILDFQPGKDKIILDRTTFKKLGKSVDFAAVNTRQAAKTSSALITYIQSTGKLYYNQNGSAADFGTGGLFAIVSPGTALTAADVLTQA